MHILTLERKNADYNKDLKKTVERTLLTYLNSINIMSVLYKPVIDPDPIDHDSGNLYTLAGYIPVGDQEEINYVGKNTNEEFQFDIVSGTEPAGDRLFSVLVERVNNQPSGKVVTKKGEVEEGESVFAFG
ncbi:MAG: hypothetical protein CL840_14435 [Crocinitomicaceae bacterium]|nr:hypothetical protein [Crocinitomicaceae bacterium]